jgi:hypothetical protein
LEAIDQLWSSLHNLSAAKMASKWMQSIVFDEAVKESAKNPKARQLFATLADPVIELMKKKPNSDAANARPYVTPIAWALFSAYQAIGLLAVMQLSVLKSGLDDMADFISSKNVVNLAQTALPHQKKFIQEHGPDACHYLLEELETKLLEEIQRMLQGKESDKASVEQAAAILKASEELSKAIAERQAEIP